MEKPNLPAIRACRPAWNKGRIIDQKSPTYAQTCLGDQGAPGDFRESSRFGAVQSCNRQQVTRMRSGQFEGRGCLRGRPDQGGASITQSKTQKPVKFEITEGTRKSLLRWMEEPLMIGSEYLWPGRFHERLHISTRQHARLAQDWVKSIDLEPSAYGTHSMRRTKVAQIYRKTGNLRAVQLRLGHTNMDSTVRCLGVELEDALTIAEAFEI